MITGKNVLITGGAGFIGTHVAQRLAHTNRITVLDIDLNGPIRYSPLAHDQRVRMVEGDVRDCETVRREVEKAQVVLHFASILGVKQVIDNARATIDTIVMGTRNVLEAAKHQPHIERIVYISTSEVYGSVMDATEGIPARIGTSNDARLSYASAKLMGEHLTWAYHRDYRLPTIIVRPFNIYGPMRITGDAIGRFVVMALSDRNVTLYGDGSQIRSWCYIDDFCDAMMSCLEADRAVGMDFNVGNPLTGITIYDLAQRTIRLAGSKSHVSTTPHTFSDIGARAPNSSRAREILGYTPRFDMDAGLKPTIAWFREHLDDFQHWL
jgi:nucleoside-diphosphate-sugar epimerase